MSYTKYNKRAKTLKKLLLLLFIFSFGCNNENKLTMERGIQFYEWDMLEEAIMEFKNVTHALGTKSSQLDYSKIKLLSRAHHNLAVAYAKKKWYPEATKEAKKAFALYPSEENKRVLELIRKKSTSSQEALKKPIQ
jgi:hypothetical protein